MHLKNHITTIHACRFCFMCRHLSPIGNVTFRESDTPRGRALLMDRMLASPELLANADFQEAIYNADLSGACRTHCVSHYDEVGLVLAARRDIVEAGAVPSKIRDLAREIEAARPLVAGPESAPIVYYVDRHTAGSHPEIAASLQAVLQAAGLGVRTVTGVDSGKSLHVLGFAEAATRVASAFAACALGGAATTLVTSCPAAYDAFKNDYPAWGVSLGNLEVLHSSELILRLKDKLPNVGGRKVVPLASDYLKKDNPIALEGTLGALGFDCVPFGFNSEESYSAGEGAVVLDRLNPSLVAQLAGYVAERVSHPATDVLVTASPYTKFALTKFGGGLTVRTLEELAAAQL